MLIILAHITKQEYMTEKIFKVYLMRTRKTTGNQTIQQKSHQRYRYLGCPSCKILGNIFEMDEGKKLKQTDQRIRKTHEGCIRPYIHEMT